MDTHVRVLGVIHIALGVLGLMFGVLMLIGLGGAASIIGASADPDDAAIAIPILSVAGTALVIILFSFSLPSVVTGIGLLYFKAWARVLGIVLSAIALLGFPWVTLLGIYGLWVLFSRETERLFSTSAS